MASNPNVNKVVYGNDTLIDLTSDTVTASTLMQGYTAHDKSGARIVGNVQAVETLNVGANNANADYTQYNVNKYVNNVKVGAIRTIVNSGLNINYLRRDVFASESEEKIVYALNTDYEVRLIANGNNIQLVLYVHALETSRITIATTGASYRETFKLIRIYLITERLFFIQYLYGTSATANSANTARLIAIKSDDTLAQSGTVNMSAVSSATAEIEAWLIPNADWSSYGMFYTSLNLSTGALGIFTRLLYVDLDALSLSAGGSSFTTIASSNVNVYCGLVSDTARLGLFYTNSSGVKNIYLNLGRNTGVKTFSVDDVLNTLYLKKPRTVDEIRSNTIYGDAKILGILSDGSLVVHEMQILTGSISGSTYVSVRSAKHWVTVYNLDIVTPALKVVKVLKEVSETVSSGGFLFSSFMDRINKISRFYLIGDVLYDRGDLFVSSMLNTYTASQIMKLRSFADKYSLVQLTGNCTISEVRANNNYLPSVYNYVSDWFHGFL